MARTDIDTVANYFLISAHEAGDCLTNLKLQKLVYYAQAWYLALKDEPLFDGEFEAWIHGPVNTHLYNRFRHYRWNPIDENPERRIEADVADYLDEIIDVFGGETAYNLERMTHSEEPWIEARGGIPNNTPSSSIISQETMKSYYRKLADKD